MKSRSLHRAGVLIIRWMVAPVLLLSAGFLVASNVILQTGMVRGWLERKLEKRAGLDWTIRSLSWTPWTGVQVGGVTAELPGTREPGVDPIYAVQEMDVEIYWGELWRGNLAPRELRLRGVRAAVPIEVMELLPDPKRSREQEQTGNGEVVEATPGPGPRPGAEETEPPVVQGDGEEATPEPQAAPKVGAVQPGPLRDLSRRPPPGRAVTIFVDDCELRIYSLHGHGKGGLKLEGVQAEIPLGGEDTEGWLAIGAITLGGGALAGSFRVPLEWRRPFLAMQTQMFEWSGLEVQAGAAVQAWGAPLCTVQARVGPGALPPTAVAPWPDVTVEAGRVEMRSRFQGNLIDVQSWRGDSMVDLVGVEVRQKDGREDLRFEWGSMRSVLVGRAVQVADARLVSERLSFLGNGVVLADGRALGIVRVVADREYTEALTKVAVGSFLAGGWTQSWLQPLQTPDRYYRDLNVRGTIGQATVDVGKDGELMRVDQAWDRMVAFLKQEVVETEAGIPPSPQRERIWIPQSP